MKASTKDNIIVYVAVASFIVGTVLTFLGCLLPPVGQIDNTVLVALGQFLTLCAAGLGLREYVVHVENKIAGMVRPDNNKEEYDG